MCIELPWDIISYNIIDNRILYVEIKTPLIDFMYLKIDDVKKAWVKFLGQFIEDQPGIDMSWEMEPRNDDALVTIKIAKSGGLPEFSAKEAKGAIDAIDAVDELFERS